MALATNKNYFLMSDETRLIFRVKFSVVSFSYDRLPDIGYDTLKTVVKELYVSRLTVRRFKYKSK
jgi:hypothetical protein